MATEKVALGFEGLPAGEEEDTGVGSPADFTVQFSASGDQDNESSTPKTEEVQLLEVSRASPTEGEKVGVLECSYPSCCGCGGLAVPSQPKVLLAKCF